MGRKSSERFNKLSVVLNLVRESVNMAFSTMKTDKFRTILSFLGVSVGIFSIVTIFIVVDSLQHNVKMGLSSFNNDVVYIQKLPWVPDEEDGTEYKWWDYLKRPDITEKDFEILKDNLTYSKYMAYMAPFYKIMKYGRKSLSRCYVLPHTSDFFKIINVDLEEGRYFSETEYKNGGNGVVIGNNIAQSLFVNEDPIGKSIKIGGSPMVVIGVAKKQGESIVSIFDIDNAAFITLNSAKTIYNNKDGSIVVSPKVGISSDVFISELKAALRVARRIPPQKMDNFAINQLSFITSNISIVFRLVDTMGWIIGGFSLLIGGFGIANIMFVSVKERTKEIGIEKALGAKKYLIMTQFLVEAAVLSLLGGLTGIA